MVAHRQDTVISILVAGTLRSEAPLRDMAGRVAGAAGGCERGAARARGGGSGGVGSGAAAVAAAVAAAAAASALLQPCLHSRGLRLDCGRRAAATPDGNLAPPGPAGGPRPIGAASAGGEPYPNPKSSPYLGRLLPARFTLAKTNTPPELSAVLKGLGRLVGVGDTSSS